MNREVAELLQQGQAALRRGRPEVRPVVQVTCELIGETPEAAAARGRAQILMWLRDKQSIRGMPENAWDGAAFEIDATQGRPVSVEAHDHVWALRYDNPGEGPHGRIWRTEAIVGRGEQSALVGVRLTTITRDWDVPIVRSVPRIVSDLADSPGLRDYGVELRARPWRVESERDVDELVDLLENPRRTRPVFVVSEDAAGNSLIDATALASRAAGLGHVVILSEDASWVLSHLLGKRLSVYGQGVRTYLAGFSRSDALFEEHPLATPQWLVRRFPDPRAFVILLANQAIDASVSSGDLEARLPGFGRVRDWVIARRIDAARQEKGSEKIQLQLYEESNQSLHESLRDKQGELEKTELDKLQLEEERDAALRQARNLRARIAFLEHALKARDIVERIEYPGTFDDLDEWVAQHLGNRLTLLSRAARASKKSEFEDLRLVCDALRLLAGPYRDMKLGAAPKGEFDRACGELGLELSLTGEASIRLYQSDYVVAFGKEKRELDLHLKKGNSREPKNCLRIYFFWDGDGEQVVVGHLPGHLTTASS